MKKLGKKGMRVGDLYQFVLLIVLIGIILGVGVLVLDKFANTGSVGNNASEVINETIVALEPISSDWLPLIVTVAVIAIVLTLVIGAFAMRGGGR